MKTLILALALVLAAPVAAREAQGLRIVQPWSRATPPGAATAAGYMVIANEGAAPDRLLGGASPVSAQLQVHEMTMDGGIMRMRQVAGGLVVPAGGTVTLRPGGLHIMFIGLRQPLRAGERLPAVLRFERAGEVAVTFEVQALGGMPGAAHGGGH
jgi:copper(I)-binding protein